MFEVAILAGGLATRLRPITETIPKALVEVAGKPFIEHQLDYLRDQGVKHVVICVGYLGDMVRNSVCDGESHGIKVSYSYDGNTLLGTGGALVRAAHLLGDHFFVLYGDSFLPINFFKVQKEYVRLQKKSLMTIIKNNNQWDKSNVLFFDGKIHEYNKRHPRPEMKYIDYGLSVVAKSELMQFSSAHCFDLAEFYQKISLDGQLAGFEVYDRFYEIGSHSGLKETEEYFIKKEKK